MEIYYPEGATPLDSDELAGLKFAHIETRAELDQLEQQNIQEGYIWLARQRKYKDFISEEFLKALHGKLFGAVWVWAGSFRHSDKNIGVDHLMINVE
jgi:fido (protein-threonine AMPylation protein)